MASWIHQFDLFLFDFDGLLVNTEHLHFAAYVKMCEKRGVKLNWDFNQFCGIAHFDSHLLRQEIYGQYPELFLQEPNWDILYSEKKRAYLEVLNEGNLQLMPGVEPLLKALDRANIRRCVATNSPKEQIDIIKKALPLLNTIPVWITREQYERPKPEPDAYLKAIELMAKPNDRIIGLEDSIRGVKALKGAKTKALFICPYYHPQFDELSNNFRYFQSLEEIPKDFIY